MERQQEFSVVFRAAYTGIVPLARNIAIIVLQVCFRQNPNARMKESQEESYSQFPNRRVLRRLRPRNSKSRGTLRNRNQLELY